MLVNDIQMAHQTGYLLKGVTPAAEKGFREVRASPPAIAAPRGTQHRATSPHGIRLRHAPCMLSVSSLVSRVHTSCTPRAHMAAHPCCGSQHVFRPASRMCCAVRQVNYTVRVAGEYEMSIAFAAAAGGGSLPGSPYTLTVHPAKASVRAHTHAPTSCVPRPASHGFSVRQPSSRAVVCSRRQPNCPRGCTAG